MTIIVVEHVMKAILAISDEVLVLHQGQGADLGRTRATCSPTRG